jgi:hypothetical protein
MPVACPRKNALEKDPSRPTTATVAKKDFLRVLRRAHIPEETIKVVDEQLQDPIDEERDGLFLVRHGLDRDQLVSRMGGSP